MCNCTRGFEPHFWKHFLFNFKYFKQMCKCLDGRVVKALDLGSDVQLHACVRTPLLANIFYLTSNTSNKCVSAWMAEWLRRWIQDPMCICTRGFESYSWQTFFIYIRKTGPRRAISWPAWPGNIPAHHPYTTETRHKK